MAHILADRVLESTVTTGTGALTLAGAVTGFRRFSAVCATGDTVPYFIEAIDSLGQPTGDYEYGIGTYSAANELTRTTVQGSSNAGAAVDFTAGTKNVAVCMTSAELASQLAALLVSAQAAAATAVEAATFPGEITLAAVKSPPAGKRWLKCNGLTIGSAASGATARANADVEALYVALWTDWTNTILPIQTSAGAATSRGASAAADFAANKRLPLPDIRGEFPRFWDDGKGIDSARAFGSWQADEIKSHSHGGMGGFSASSTGGGVMGVNGGGVASTGSTGGTETRPRNIALQGFIRY